MFTETELLFDRIVYSETLPGLLFVASFYSFWGHSDVFLLSSAEIAMASLNIHKDYSTHYVNNLEYTVIKESLTNSRAYCTWNIDQIKRSRTLEVTKYMCAVAT